MSVNYRLTIRSCRLMQLWSSLEPNACSCTRSDREKRRSPCPRRRPRRTCHGSRLPTTASRPAVVGRNDTLASVRIPSRDLWVDKHVYASKYKVWQVDISWTLNIDTKAFSVDYGRCGQVTKYTTTFWSPERGNMKDGVKDGCQYITISISQAIFNLEMWCWCLIQVC